jgi:hypothetical protein
MATFLLIGVSAIPGFLWLTGADDVGSTKIALNSIFSSCS